MAGDAVAITIATDHDDGRNMLIKKDTFCLYASPAVNLFPKIALPGAGGAQKNRLPGLP